MRIGEGDKIAGESEVAWEKFVRAVAEAGGVTGHGKNFHGTSLNLEERRWVGALGCESSEVSLNSLLILLLDEDNSADFGILDQEKSTGQYSCEGC